MVASAVSGLVRRHRRGCLLAWCIAVLASAHADPKQEPLWELGLGVGVVAFSDYTGSDRILTYPVPFPYLIYRGSFFRSDRDGLRGLFVNNPVIEFNVSGDASAPVTSSQTHARQGMPNLKAALELGPSLDWHIWRPEDRHLHLDLQLPVRGAMTVASPPRSIGGYFAPRLNLDVFDLDGHSGWNLELEAGPLIASQRYVEYYYGVAPQYATGWRPTYEAPGGYAGSEVYASLIKRFKKFRVRAIIGLHELSGASFNSSPLVRSNFSLTAGVGVAWMIGHSSKMVDAVDDVH